jgi:adenylate cyclase
MMVLRRPSARATLTILFVLIGAAWGGFLGLRHLAARASALDALENLSLDRRYSLAGPRTPPPRRRHRRHRRGDHPPGRRVSAAAQCARADRAGDCRHNPQVICVDVLLLDPGNAEADRELADALHAGRSIIGAVALFGRDAADEVAAASPGDAFIQMPSSILWPQEVFRAAAQPGLSNVSTDLSGVPRYVPLLFEYQGAIIPSFALASAAAALNTDPVLGNDEVKLRAIGHAPPRLSPAAAFLRTVGQLQGLQRLAGGVGHPRSRRGARPGRRARCDGDRHRRPLRDAVRPRHARHRNLRHRDQ